MTERPKLYSVANTKGRGLVDAVFSKRENAEEWIDSLYEQCEADIPATFRITYTRLDCPGAMYDLGIYKPKQLTKNV